ncbi:hypothetical protein EJ110_NYTH35594 [Nymphaea thermarum]|nr:hypothetical protein EJ110_NYTH35594 [Nymphaea thermarum]
MESDLGEPFIGVRLWDGDEDHLEEYFKTCGEVVEAMIMICLSLEKIKEMLIKEIWMCLSHEKIKEMLIEKIKEIWIKPPFKEANVGWISTRENQSLQNLHMKSYQIKIL